MGNIIIPASMGPATGAATGQRGTPGTRPARESGGGALDRRRRQLEDTRDIVMCDALRILRAARERGDRRQLDRTALHLGRLGLAFRHDAIALAAMNLRDAIRSDDAHAVAATCARLLRLTEATVLGQEPRA